MCLAILSLDDKRRVGDRLGPATEQFIFREVAAIVAKHTRNCDMVARYGDNELAILIPNCELEEACHIAERVRVAVANHKPRYQGNDLRPNVSIGVAKAGRQSADIMLRLSEDAYRMAQRSGGNAVYFHDGHKCRPFTIARLQKAKEESNPNNKPGRERRRHPRRPFRTTQFLAVCANNKLPKAKDFQPVQCNDISPGGCSFFLDRPPEWEYVVVGLGSPPELMYFHARVRNVSTVTEGNRTWIRVGCEFTARLNAEQFGVEPEQIAKPVLAIVSGDYQEGVHQNCVGATR